MNISSIIIQTNDAKKTSENLAKINGVEVAIVENSTIIATLEAENTNEEIALLEKISQTNGVISAAMHYTYFEDTLRDEIARMNDKEAANKLNDDNLPLESLTYSGSVESIIKRSKKR